MLYVRDYGALGGFAEGAQAALVSRLRGMEGEAVTVFTTGGGAQGRGFSGILCEAGSDFLRLAALPPGPVGRCGGRRCANCAGRPFRSTGILIPLRQVTAVSFRR